MTAITVSDLRFKLNDILARLVNGDSFIVKKAGKSVAQISPILADSQTKPSPIFVSDNLKYLPIEIAPEDLKNYDYTTKISTPSDRHTLPEITINLPIRH